MLIQENIERVKRDIKIVAEGAGRNAEEITLIAVSKTMGCDRISDAITAGHLIFGENRVQELMEKIRILGKNPCWHLIGHLQTNKVKYVVGEVELIHSVDSLHLAEEISKQANKKRLIQDVLLEVNAGGEESKFGLTIEETPYIIDKIGNMEGVRVRGLMTVAPPAVNPEEVRPVFRSMKNLFDSLNRDGYSLDILSMGMSNDYKIAIEEGSTMVRVGSAIFGKRTYF